MRPLTEAELKAEVINNLKKQKELVRNLKKQYYSTNYYEFNRDVLGWKDIYEPLHRPLANFITDNIKKKHLLIELPRGSFKSSLVTIGYSLWRIVNNPNIRILLVNATYQMVVNFISQIQDHLQKNEALKEIYGDLSIDAVNWSDNTIKLKTSTSYERKEPTVFGYGMTGNLVSAHEDLIILDDLVNWDNIGTKEQIDKTINFYQSTLDLLEPPDGTFDRGLIIIGTTYHYADLYSWIENPENRIHSQFAIFKKPAFTGDWGTGQLAFPNRLSWERLKYLRKSQRPSHFSSQYMLVPILDEDAIFKYEFRYYEETDLKGVELNTFVLIDPAISTAAEADQTAIVVVSVDTDNTWYVRDLKVGRWAPNDLIQEIISVDTKWRPLSIGIEEVAFQKALSVFLREEVKRQRRLPLPIKPIKHERLSTGLTVSKDYRIQSLEPMYAEGKIFHNKNLDSTIALEDQLRRFPKNDHDDIIDSLSMARDFVFSPRRREQRSEMESSTGRKYLY